MKTEIYKYLVKLWKLLTFIASSHCKNYVNKNSQKSSRTTLVFNEYWCRKECNREMFDWAWGFPGGTSGEEPACQCRTRKRQKMQIWSLGWEEPLEWGNVNPLQYSCLENPMNRGSGGLQSIGSHRVRHDWSILAGTQTAYALEFVYFTM